MALMVEILNGVYDGYKQRIRSFPITIGRATENDISIPLDTAVSRSHAKIVYEDSKKVFVLMDLNSTNGTFKNDVQIKDQIELKSGDIIKIGDSYMKCVVVD